MSFARFCLSNNSLLVPGNSTTESQGRPTSATPETSTGDSAASDASRCGEVDPRREKAPTEPSNSSTSQRSDAPAGRSAETAFSHRDEAHVGIGGTPSGAPNRPTSKLAEAPVDAEVTCASNHDEEKPETPRDGLATNQSAVRQQSAGQVTSVPIDQLVELGEYGHSWTQTEVRELADHLEVTPLGSPISACRLEGGGLGILSGRRRVAALRLLGRAEIQVVVVDIPEADAPRVALFSHLLQGKLSDYDKFRCLQGELHRSTTPLRQADLVQAACMTRQEVSRLLSFGRLSDSVLKLLDEYPHVMGATCAARLAAIAKLGKEDSVLEAVRRLVTGQHSQADAVAYAKDDLDLPSRATTRHQSIGKICSFSGKGKMLTIDCGDKGNRVEIEAVIMRALHELEGQRSTPVSQVATN